MTARLTRFFDIRPGEGLPVALAFAYVAIVVASVLLAKPVRNALFLTEFGAFRLVYVYVGVPLVLSLFVPLYTRIAARYGPRVLITGTLVILLLNVLVFWYLLRFHPVPALAAIFFIWVNCYAVIVPVQAWGFASVAFDTRQGKRLFGLVGSGASLGAIAGGLLAVTLVRPLGGTVNLLLVIAVLIAVAIAIVNAAWAVLPPRARRRPPRAARARFRETLGVLARTPYLRLLAAMVFLVAIATQWVGFQFSLVADLRFAGDADRLTAFFGRFNLAMGVAAFLLQLLLTGPLLRRYGVGLALVLLPLALAAGSSLIVLFPAMAAVLLTNAFDQGLRFSLDKATYELLYLPLPPALRSRVKVTIDTIVNRTADAAGGVLLGVATQGFLLLPGAGLGLRGTAAINLGFIGAWIAAALALRRGYVQTIRDSILQHRLDTERSSATVLDRSAVELVTRSLRADDAREVLYALGLLEMERHPTLHPALLGLLSHPVAEVRRRALAMLGAAGDDSLVMEAERLVHDEDLETRTEALLYLTRYADVDPLDRVQAVGDFPDFSIRAGMVAFLAREGRARNLEAARVLLEGMIDEREDHGARSRIEAARLFARLPDELGDLLERLVRDPDPDVAREAIRSAGARRRLDLTAAVLDRLGDPPLTAEAGAALASTGDACLDALRARLFDPTVPIDQRREIPGVLVRIATPAAHALLLHALFQPDTALRFRIISSLNKLRQSHPDFALDAQAVETVLAAEIAGHYRSYQILGSLQGRVPEEDPVMRALRQSLDQEIERIFRLLSLLFPQQDLHSAYVGLRSPDPLIRANALEFLDNVLKPQLRALLVPLLDGTVTVAERVRLADRFVGAPVETLDQAVGTLLAADDPWLRSCAAYAVGVLQIASLGPELEKALEDPDPLLREAAHAARQRLRGEVDGPAEPPPGLVRSWQGDETMGVG